MKRYNVTQALKQWIMTENIKINPTLKQNLSKLLKYDQKTFVNLVVSRLKEPLSNEVAYI